MKFNNLLLSFLICAILFAPAALAYQSEGPTGFSGFVLGIVSSVSDFLSKLFATPNLVVSDAKFSGNDLQITIINTGKAVANFRSDIVDVGIDSESGVNLLCKSSGNYCIDNPTSGVSCTANGGHCAVRAAKTGFGQCSCVFRPKAAASQSIKLNAGQSTTITIENVGAPTASTQYSFKIKASGNIREVSTVKIISPGGIVATKISKISSSSSCSETDGGDDPTTPGTLTIDGVSYKDTCGTDSNNFDYVTEYYCDGGDAYYKNHGCTASPCYTAESGGYCTQPPHAAKNIK